MKREIKPWRFFARLFSVLIFTPAALAQIPTADSFNPGVNGEIHTLAIQPDGRILVGGIFSQLAGEPRNNIGRLHPDGSLDADFDPGGDWTVKVLALQTDGRILMGRSFWSQEARSQGGLVRLNSDGTVDSSFDPQAEGGVRAVLVQPDGKIVLGGDFTSLGGEERRHLGRLNADGTLDSSFNPGAAEDTGPSRKRRTAEQAAMGCRAGGGGEPVWRASGGEPCVSEGG